MTSATIATASLRIPAIEIPILLGFVIFAVLIVAWFVQTLVRRKQQVFQDEHFNQFVAAFAALVAVLAANITYLQSDASTLSDRYGRDAQRFVVQAMGLKTSSQAQVGFALNSAQNWYELSKLAGSARQAGAGDIAQQYLNVRTGLTELSPLLSPIYRLDLLKYEADLYVRPATALIERYSVASGLSDAWGGKGNDYITQIALLAVVLFLLGLSAAIGGRVRLLFFGTAIAILSVASVWLLVVLARPIDSLPQSSVDQYARGVGLAHQLKYADALAVFDTAIADAPTYANAYYERALAHQALKEYPAALRDFAAARANGRDDASTAWNEGWTYYLAGQLDDAVRTDRHALEMNPELLPVRANLGLALLAGGQIQDAQREYAVLMEQAITETVAAREAGNSEQSYSFWANLDTAARDLQSLLEQRTGQPRAWTQAPPADAISASNEVASTAQALYSQLRSLATSLELNGQPASGNLSASIGPFIFSSPFGRGGGGGPEAEPRTPFESGVAFDAERKVYFPARGAISDLHVQDAETPPEYITDTFAYGTDIVVLTFKASGLREGQSILWKGYLNGQEDLSLRHAETWTLGLDAQAQRGITFMFGGAGEYSIEMYVGGQLAQQGRFTIRPKGANMDEYAAHGETQPSQADNSLAIENGAVKRIGKGVLNTATWLPTGNGFAVASALGVYLYQATLLTDTAYITQTGFISTPAPVSTLAASPDSKQVAAVVGNAVYLLDLASGQTVHTLQGHTDYINSVFYSADGQRLVTASADKTIRVWDMSNGESLAVLQGHGDSVSSAIFSTDGTLIVSGSRDATARIWDAGSGMLRATLQGHTNTVQMAIFSPDGALVATASADMTIKLWETQSGKLLTTLRGHTRAVNTLAFSRDGQRLLSSSADKSFRLWDMKTGKAVVRAYHDDNVATAEFSPDDAFILTASWDNTIQFTDAAKMNWIYTLRGYRDYVNGVAFSPDGSHVLSADRDKHARVWDARNGALLTSLSGHSDAVLSAAFSPDGSRVATASSDHTLKVWSTATGEKLADFAGHNGAVYAIAFNADNLQLASGGDDGDVKVWMAATGELLQTLQGASGAVLSVAFGPLPPPDSSDTQLLASGGMDKTVRIWDARSRKLLHTLSGHSSEVSSVAFSADGTQLLSADHDGTIKLWDAVNGKLLREVATLDDEVNSVAFSPDGKRIAAGTRNQRVIIWDNVPGSGVAQEYTGHVSAVNGVAFSPDGKRLVSASSDGTLRFWDIK
jgi:WD40 repeat protein/tetratricopeptide (TPR) repeat protein